MAFATTEYDWSILDLSEELHSIWVQAQAFKSFANADDISITTRDGYWNLTISYGPVLGGEYSKYTRDFRTVEELRAQIDSFVIAARIANKLEI
jgi:hypothetical protein